MCPVSTGMTYSSAGVRRPADTSVEQLERDEPNSRRRAAGDTAVCSAKARGLQSYREEQESTRGGRAAPTGTRAGFRGNGLGPRCRAAPHESRGKPSTAGCTVWCIEAGQVSVCRFVSVHTQHWHGEATSSASRCNLDYATVRRVHSPRQVQSRSETVLYNV